MMAYTYVTSVCLCTLYCMYGVCMYARVPTAGSFRLAGLLPRPLGLAIWCVH